MTLELPGNLPTLITQRLRIRPFYTEDAPMVQKLAGDKAISDATINIPYPYDLRTAEIWIESHSYEVRKGICFNLAVELKEEPCLIGNTSLFFNREHHRAELGYWIGKPYWGKGYCTEAAAAVLEYGFKELKLQRIFAHVFKDNTASVKVLEKIGMTYEGCLRKHIKKHSCFKDESVYSMLAEEFFDNLP